MSTSTFTILHGEDEFIDSQIIDRILQKMGYKGQYVCFELGQELLDYINKQGDFSNAKHTLPDLIILDIGLPDVNGIDLLKMIRSSNATQHIPVLMTSGSVSERDYRKCIALGCNAYLQKNERIEIFNEICINLLKSWFMLCRQKFV